MCLLKFLVSWFDPYSEESTFKKVACSNWLKMDACEMIDPYGPWRHGVVVIAFFKSAIWMPQGQLWTIIEGAASLTRC